MKTLQTITTPFYKVFRGYGSTEQEQGYVYIVLWLVLMACVLLFGKVSPC